MLAILQGTFVCAQHQYVKWWYVRTASADAFINHLSQQTRQFLVLVVDVFDDIFRSWS